MIYLYWKYSQAACLIKLISQFGMLSQIFLLILSVLIYYRMRCSIKLIYMISSSVRLQDRARELDKLSAEQRKKLLLFGIPCSVKENYHLADYVSTHGCSVFIDDKKSKSAATVQVSSRPNSSTVHQATIPNSSIVQP